MTVQTTSETKILVIDDDPFFTDLISSCLTEHAIQACHDGSSVNQGSEIASYDLVILDIDLKDQNGYELCKKIRQTEKYLPILFASGMSDLDARLKAYGSGGNDYLSKPFQAQELHYKVTTLIKQHQATNELRAQLSQTSSLVTGIQTDSSNLQHVNRFILHSSHCKDLDSLYQIFFHTLHELGTEGALQINRDRPIASNGHLSRLETEILEMASQLPRIYSFGKGRACFVWSNVKLLIRNIGPLIDTIAILMDAMEICIQRISHEQKLIEEIARLENYSSANKIAIGDLFTAMTDSISNELLMLGIVSSLNEDEEERLKTLMDQYNDQAQQHLDEQDRYNHQLKDAVNAMRTPNSALTAFLDKISRQDNNTDSVELF